MNHNLHARASAIAEGWERLCRTPLWHAAGCRCAGGVGCLLINLASTETDLLESLIAQARSNADEPAAALVLQRLESARQGGELPPLPTGCARWPIADCQPLPSTDCSTALSASPIR